jgi:hypothetical protein
MKVLLTISNSLFITVKIDITSQDKKKKTTSSIKTSIDGLFVVWYLNDN